MSDRTYTRFSVSLSVLADAVKSEAVRTTFGLTTAEFQKVILAEPAPDEAAGYEGTTIRLLDGRPCLVYEDPDCDYGGACIEHELTEAGVPFLQVNGAGHEYGPASTVFDGRDSEVIRLSHDLAPVVGIGVVDGRVTLDQQEVADYDRYLRIRQAVLLFPALAGTAAA